MFERTFSRNSNPFNAAYGDKVKRSLLEFYIGQKKLSELNKYVVITAFRLDGGPEIHGCDRIAPKQCRAAP